MKKFKITSQFWKQIAQQGIFLNLNPFKVIQPHSSQAVEFS